MTYRILPDHLREGADRVAGFLRDNYGARGIEREVALNDDVPYRPTLVGRMTDHHVVAVDVTDAGYTGAHDGFVLDCQTRGLPVKFFIATPEQMEGARANALIRAGRARGVGVIEIRQRSCDAMLEPVSLSLCGVRRIVPTQFPPRFRQRLATAQSTFLNGDPVKGCGGIYDVIEHATRLSAKRLVGIGILPNPPIELAKAPWSEVLEFVRSRVRVDRLPQPTRGRFRPVMARIIGLVPDRNDSGHEPNDRASLIRRDSELRTRFEHAVGTLVSLIEIMRGTG